MLLVRQAVTDFHILLLFPSRLLVLNAVSQAPVQDIALAGRGAPGYAGQPLALITDPATAAVYLATSAPPLQPRALPPEPAPCLPRLQAHARLRAPDRSRFCHSWLYGLLLAQLTWAVLHAGDGLAEISVRDEGRGMWRVHLRRGSFQAAARAARTQGQRNIVNIAEADAALEAGDTKRAARLYGKARPLQPPSSPELRLQSLTKCIDRTFCR